jgi:RNA-directed DNA polymerase
VNWVLDADIRGFFDTIKFIEHRIADRRVLRLVQKWLRAGVMEQGKRTPTEVGSPQGATVSPLLANICLHYTLDLWVQQWRQRHGHGDIIIVRYSDDFVLGFQHDFDAQRFLRDLRERLARFKLELHPEKTRLLGFGRFASSRRKERGKSGAPQTFNFLGLTHCCGRSRNGKFLLLRHTMRRRLTAKVHEIALELRRRRHESIASCHRPAYWSQRMIGVMRPRRDRHHGATRGSACKSVRVASHNFVTDCLISDVTRRPSPSPSDPIVHGKA